jgi:hypothetical protein
MKAVGTIGLHIAIYGFIGAVGVLATSPLEKLRNRLAKFIDFEDNINKF